MLKNNEKILMVAGAAVTLVVVVLVGVTLLVDVDQFRPALEKELAGALGRPVTIGHIRLSLLSGAISVDDVSIADDRAFGSAPFLKAKALNVGVDIVPLIVSKTLRVRSFTLDAPEVTLQHAPDGTWNFSSLGVSPADKKGASGAQATAAPPTASVAKLTMRHGRITVGLPGKSRVYEDVSVEATDLSYTSRFPFRASAKTPGGGTIDVTGTAGPIDSTDAAKTPLQASLEVTHLDLTATGLFDPASGIGGLVDLTGTLTSDGRQASIKGQVRANKLQLVRGSSPSRVPVEIDYESQYDLMNQRGVVKQGDVHVGKAVARATGTYDTRGETPAVRMTLVGRAMPVPELEASLPALGITLPAGAAVRTGTLDTELVISGPIDRLVVTGPMSVSNATVAGFDLGSKMSSVAAFAGLAKRTDTVIERLAGNFQVTPDGIRADRLDLIVPAIGSMNGQGTIAATGALHFTMLAKGNASNAVAGAVSRVASLGHPENGVPFRVEGTTANPVFIPDVSTAVRGLVNSNLAKTPGAVASTSGVLRGLLDKKK